MSTHSDLTQLEQRLRQAAAELEPHHLALPTDATGSWQRQLMCLNEHEDTRFVLFVPNHPRLEELLAYHQSDSVFVEGLYRHLMGRESDPEGHAFYSRQTAHDGRLMVLGRLLREATVQQYLRQQAVVLTPGVQRLASLTHLASSGGRRRQRLQQKALRKLFETTERLKRRRWASTSSFYQHLARSSADQQTRRTVADALLEIDQRQQMLIERQEHQHARLGSVWRQVAEVRRRVSAEPTRAAAHAEKTEQANAPATHPAVAGALPAELEAYYLAFEDAFRGEEANISAHLECYRSAWTRARQAGVRALDLGCGRGEWLRLLDQAGFEPAGIDLNATMVAHCLEQGFAVEHQDALVALQQQADDSHALISGFHIAEHLPFATLFQLVAEAWRVLAPGGVLILETPNPENLIVASYSFYHDLTHRNPLTPVTLEFLCQFQGFQTVEVLRLSPPPETTRIATPDPAAQRLDQLLMAPMDYAVIATKHTSAEAPA